jgi:hypothetical protein
MGGISKRKRGDVDVDVDITEWRATYVLANLVGLLQIIPHSPPLVLIHRDASE